MKDKLPGDAVHDAMARALTNQKPASVLGRYVISHARCQRVASYLSYGSGMRKSYEMSWIAWRSVETRCSSSHARQATSLSPLPNLERHFTKSADTQRASGIEKEASTGDASDD